MPSCKVSTWFVCPGDQVSVDTLFTSQGGAVSMTGLVNGLAQNGQCGNNFQINVNGKVWNLSTGTLFIPADAPPTGTNNPPHTVSICATDNNGSVACPFNFRVREPADVACNGGVSNGCVGIATQTVTVDGSITIQPGQLNNSGQAPIGFTESANGITQVGGLNPISITGLANGTNTISFTFPNGDVCPVTIVVSNGGGGGNGDVTGQVFGDNACNGSVRVCLQNSNGTPYFGNFDICGGVANGGGNTGPQNGSASCQLSNFQQINNAQCFDYAYTPASNSATSDTIVVQPTDDNGAPVGNAISIPFTFDACDGGGNDLVCEVNSISVQSPQTITAAQLAMGGTQPYQASGISPITTDISIQNGNISVAPGVAPGTYPMTITITDANGEQVTCPIDFIVQGDNGDMSGCIDTAASTVAASQGPFGPGDTVTITTDIVQQNGTVGLPDHFVVLKDSAGNLVSPTPTFISVTDNVVTWRWVVPNSCTNGVYSVCVFPPANGLSCPEWDAGTITLSGCSDDPGPGPVSYTHLTLPTNREV